MKLQKKEVRKGWREGRKLKGTRSKATVILISDFKCFRMRLVSSYSLLVLEFLYDLALV